jgi:hypothetical protein
MRYENEDELPAAADRAMYRDKGLRRGRRRLAHPFVIPVA